MNIMNSLASITPGYRSNVKWKMLLATVVYSIIFLILLDYFLLKAIILVIYFMLLFYAYDRFTNKYRERIKKLNEAIHGQSEFCFADRYVSQRGDWALAMDIRQRILCVFLLRSKYSNVQFAVIPCRDILEVEILENGCSLARVSRESHEDPLERVSGRDEEKIEDPQNRNRKVESLELKLIINHLKNQVCTIPFSTKKLKSNSKKYFIIKESIFQWYDLVKSSINHA